MIDEGRLYKEKLNNGVVIRKMNKLKNEGNVEKKTNFCLFRTKSIISKI